MASDSTSPTSQIATVLASIAFLVSVYAAYGVYQVNQRVSSINALDAVAIVDYFEIGNAVRASSSSTEEEDIKLKLVTSQIDKLASNGYLVLDIKGEVLRAPESNRVTPEKLGISK